MTLTIDFPQEVEEWLEEEASRQGQAPAEFVRTAIVRMRRATPASVQDDVPTDWDALTALLERCQMDTGITDLAHQHDHYIHGTPKRDN